MVFHMVQIPFGIHLGVPENCVYPAVMVIFLQMMRIHWVLHPTQATGSHVPGSLSLANMVECPVVGTQESVGNGQDVALFRFHMVPCEFSRMIFVLFTPNMSFLAVRAKHLPNISTQHSGIFNLRCNALWRLGCVIH
jgi:hypothetical protein